MEIDNTRNNVSKNTHNLLAVFIRGIKKYTTRQMENIKLELKVEQIFIITKRTKENRP